MIEKLTHAPIVVSDQEKALTYYTQVLGWEKRQDHEQPGKPRWLTVAPEGQELEFILTQGEFKVDSGFGPEAGTGGHQWAFQTKDCRGDYERLKARGVDFQVGTYTEPVEQYWGRFAAFRDPDGNQFVLIEPSSADTADVAKARGKRSQSEGGPKFDKLTQVPIVVGDQDRALRFYTVALGFEKRQDGQQPGRPRWLTVGIPKQDLEFILVKGAYVVDPRPPATAVDTGGNHWVFRTNDCRADFKALEARGVKFKTSAPIEANFGVAAHFTDPDGNHLTLLQPATPSRKA